MSEENKAIAARGFEVYSTGNYDILDEVMSPDYVGHDPALPEPMRGPEAVKAAGCGLPGGVLGPPAHRRPADCRRRIRRHALDCTRNA